MAVQLQSVSSSNISKIGYENGELHVVFNAAPRDRYIYKGVHKRTFTNLMNADSPGAYFHSFVRNNYTFVKQPL